MAGKADFVNSIAEAVGLTRRQATEAFDAVFDSIAAVLKGGDTAKIPGFGSFTVAERAARKGRNPATGQTITIKASKGVRFKAGKELRESVNSKRRSRK